MPGAPDTLYVEARRVLLDALDALEDHIDSIVLVGAQAIYLHTGDADLVQDLGVAPYTTDADVAVRPDELADSPLLADALTDAGFVATENPGRFKSSSGVYLDVMVPEALAGPGTRGARLGPHGKSAARRAVGLEGALVDRTLVEITALDPADSRSIEVSVAGPAALLVAKIHKIAERTEQDGRSRDKDALDVFRLLRAVPTATIVNGLRELAASDLAGDVTASALAALPDLFGSAGSRGAEMAVAASDTSETEAEIIAASLAALVGDILAALEPQ